MNSNFYEGCYQCEGCSYAPECDYADFRDFPVLDCDDEEPVVTTKRKGTDSVLESSYVDSPVSGGEDVVITILEKNREVAGRRRRDAKRAKRKAQITAKIQLAITDRIDETLPGYERKKICIKARKLCQKAQRYK